MVKRDTIPRLSAPRHKSTRNRQVRRKAARQTGRISSGTFSLRLFPVLIPEFEQFLRSYALVHHAAQRESHCRLARGGALQFLNWRTRVTFLKIFQRRVEAAPKPSHNLIRGMPTAKHHVAEECRRYLELSCKL